MRTVLSYLRPSAKKMAWGITIKFLGTVMDLFLPWILAFVIDTVVPRRSLAQIALWGGVMFLCSVLAVVGNIAANRSAARIARDTSERIRHDLFSKTASPAGRSTISPSPRWRRGSPPTPTTSTRCST